MSRIPTSVELMEGVYREDAEYVSELKNVTGSTKLPYGALANGADGIKESITNFSDARKSDIDNEHLPPDLIDPEEFIAAGGSFADLAELSEGGDTFSSVPTTVSPDMSPGTSSPASPATEMKDVFGSPRSPMSPGSGPESPASPKSPQSPRADGPTRFRKGHGRQSSLGTTRTSPSTRRRSLENTMVMVR